MVFLSMTVFAQSEDLAYQLRLIQVLLPESTRFGFVYQSDSTDVDIDLNIAINQTGLRVFKHPVSSARELTKAVRALASRYEVDFIYVHDDTLVSSKNALKTIVNQSRKKGIPVFTLSENIRDVGGYGQIFNDEGQWRMYIASQGAENFAISVPPNDARFIIE